MSEFVIHGHPDSPYLRSVRLALEEKGMPYRIQRTADGGVRGEAHREVHPFGRVPAVERGGGGAHLSPLLKVFSRCRSISRP